MTLSPHHPNVAATGVKPNPVDFHLIYSLRGVISDLDHYALHWPGGLIPSDLDQMARQLEHITDRLAGGA